MSAQDQTRFAVELMMLRLGNAHDEESAWVDQIIDRVTGPDGKWDDEATTEALGGLLNLGMFMLTRCAVKEGAPREELADWRRRILQEISVTLP